PPGQPSLASQVPSPSASWKMLDTPAIGAQLSAGQGSPSSGSTAVPPPQLQLASNTSPMVQAFRSSQAAPGVQSRTPTQVQSSWITSPLVAPLPSSQVVPGSGPPGQPSFASQVPSPSASWKMLDTPLTGSQLSSVQGSPSSGSTAVPPAQLQLASNTSPVVQALRS